jgi:recombination protein RecR
MVLSDSQFQTLVDQLAMLPGIGKKSAARISFYLLRMDPIAFENWITSIQKSKARIRFCEECGGLSDHPVCEICESDNRETGTICIIENPEDLFSFEKTGEYKGKYHVLGGVLSPLEGVGPDKLRFSKLLERFEIHSWKEMIIATNPTLEGDATANYIVQLFKDRDIKISRIAFGIAVGGSIEFSDQYSLSRSLRSRLPMN